MINEILLGKNKENDEAQINNIISEIKSPKIDDDTQEIKYLILRQKNINKNDAHSRYWGSELIKEEQRNRLELKSFVTEFIKMYGGFTGCLILINMSYRILNPDIKQNPPLLSDAVLITLLTTTAGSILTMIIIIIKYFFKNTDKDNSKP